MDQGVRKAENKREIIVKKIAKKNIGDSTQRRFIPELLKAVISPSALKWLKFSTMEKRRDIGIIMLKEEGREKIINSNTFKTGAFSVNIRWVR